MCSLQNHTNSSPWNRGIRLTAAHLISRRYAIRINKLPQNNAIVQRLPKEWRNNERPSLRLRIAYSIASQSYQDHEGDQLRQSWLIVFALTQLIDYIPKGITRFIRTPRSGRVVLDAGTFSWISLTYKKKSKGQSNSRKSGHKLHARTLQVGLLRRVRAWVRVTLVRQWKRWISTRRLWTTFHQFLNKGHVDF